MTDITDEFALVPQTQQVPQTPVLVPLASPSCQQVCAALAIAQGEFKTPKRTKEANVEGTTRGGSSYKYKYKYAPLEEIIDSVKDALAKNGLARQQYLVARGAQPVMRTIIWHASGEWIASDYPIHPTKDGAQGFASGVTYARRYGLSLALGLAPEDDDDANEADGNVAIPAAKPVRRPAPPAANVMPPHDPNTGEIIEAGTQASAKRPPAEAPASPNDAPRPEGDAGDLTKTLMDYDKKLATAREKGMDALREAYLSIPDEHRKTFDAAIQRRHKPRAMQVDQATAKEGK